MRTDQPLDPEASKAPRWHVYIVRCGDDSLYTGIAVDVERRLEEHRAGAPRGAKYLRGRGPLALVLDRPVGSRANALRVERLVKRLSKRNKEALLATPRMLDELMASNLAGARS